MYLQNKNNNAFLIFYISLDVILFLICLMGVHQIALKAGLNLNLSIENQYITVISSPSEYQEKIRSGDKILSISGQRLNSLEEIEFLCDGLPIGSEVFLEIQRDGRNLSVAAILIQYYNLRYLIIVLLVGAFHFFLGIYIIIKRPRNIVTIILNWALISVGSIIMNTWGNYNAGFYGVPVRLVFSIAYAFAPAIFFQLSVVFPRPKWKNYKFKLLPLYFISLALSIRMIMDFIPAARMNSLIWFNEYLIIFNYSRMFFSFCLFLAVANFIHSYNTIKDEIERKKLRWVFFGLSVSALSFITLWQIPQLISSVGLIDEDIILILASFAPATFVISFIRYHILDIDLIINRSTVYFIVLILLFFIAFFIMLILNKIFGFGIDLSSILLYGIAIIIAAIIAEPLRTKVQALVNKYLFSVRFNYFEVEKNIIEEIKRTLQIKEMGELIVSKLNNFLSPEFIHFAEIKPFKPTVNFISSQLPDESGIIYHDLSNLKSKSFYSLEDEIEPGIKFEKPDESFFHKNKIALIFPVKCEESESKYFLILGKKKLNPIYALEDINMLITITGAAAYALDRIILQQKILMEQEESKRLDDLNKLKTFFVSSVSHELKTPLTSIKMFSEMLQNMDSIKESEASEYLEIINGESERLARLIDNILDFSRIERGVKEYNFRKTEVNGLISNVLKSLTYRIKMEKCKVYFHKMQDDIFINADYDSIYESILNLLDNSIKYTKEDKKITIITSLDNEMASILIEDNGIGIPENEIISIFKPFYRVKDTESQQVGGSGLGLSLVKNIMDSHKGKIEVSSIPGKGSRFSLIFQEYR